MPIEIKGGKGGAKPRLVTLKTDEDGRLYLSPGGFPIPVFATLIDSDGVIVEGQPGHLWDPINSTWVKQIADSDGKAQIAGYTAATTSNRGEEIDPVSAHHVESTPAEVTNGADGTYYYYLDMDGYRDLALQLILSGGSGTCTVTVEATEQDDGTAAASCAYQDVSNAWFGAANWTASAILLNSIQADLVAKYIRVKVVAATGAADDADWTIFAKQVF